LSTLAPTHTGAFAVKKNVQRLSLLRPVKLRLERPLAGPYASMLRRPAPELESLAQGECLVLLRARRLLQPLPLCASAISPFYGAGKNPLKPADFNDPECAARLLAVAVEGQVALLGQPAGYLELPNAPWVSRLMAELSPWSAEAVERWRRQLGQDRLWLHLLRVHTCAPQVLRLPKGRGNRVKPFRLAQLRPVLGEEVFSRRLEELVQTVAGFPSVRATTRSAPPSSPAVRAGDFAGQTGYEQARLEEWEARLRRKQQLIFCGPPGTGKTLLARYLAARLAGDGGCWELVQFHPAYAYEDFVQGLRPSPAGGFELVPGRFLEFCRRAERFHPHPCALIIDELNRANLPRVLGEVMSLLEYRDRPIPLAGGGPPFSIPENVYLIGTMNTADRSIALVDQALRRRFSFVRLHPDPQVLRSYLQRHGLPEGGLIEVLARINQSIGDPDRELGFSFFLQDGSGLRQVLGQVWQGEVEPYLEEVFFDQPEALAANRWEVLVRGPLAAWA